jgi:hypothetical protein
MDSAEEIGHPSTWPAQLRPPGALDHEPEETLEPKPGGPKPGWSMQIRQQGSLIAVVPLRTLFYISNEPIALLK